MAAETSGTERAPAGVTPSVSTRPTALPFDEIAMLRVPRWVARLALVLALGNLLLGPILFWLCVRDGLPAPPATAAVAPAPPTLADTVTARLHPLLPPTVGLACVADPAEQVLHCSLVLAKAPAESEVDRLVGLAYTTARQVAGRDWQCRVEVRTAAGLQLARRP